MEVFQTLSKRCVVLTVLISWGCFLSLPDSSLAEVDPFLAQNRITSVSITPNLVGFTGAHRDLPIHLTNLRNRGWVILQANETQSPFWRPRIERIGREVRRLGQLYPDFEIRNIPNLRIVGARSPEYNESWPQFSLWSLDTDLPIVRHEVMHVALQNYQRFVLSRQIWAQVDRDHLNVSIQNRNVDFELGLFLDESLPDSYAIAHSSAREIGRFARAPRAGFWLSPTWTRAYIGGLQQAGNLLGVDAPSGHRFVELVEEIRSGERAAGVLSDYAETHAIAPAINSLLTEFEIWTGDHHIFRRWVQHVLRQMSNPRAYQIVTFTPVREPRVILSIAAVLDIFQAELPLR